MITTSTAGPSPADLATVTAGCNDMVGLSDGVSAAADGTPGALEDMAAGADWQAVTAMQTVSSPQYRVLARDVTNLIQSYSSSVANGDLSAIEGAVTDLTTDCQNDVWSTDP